MSKNTAINKELMQRLQYVEETYAGESETWVDPKTKRYYRIPITIVRNWEDIQEL